MATTAMATSAKAEFAEAAHCFLASQSGLAGAGTNGTFTLTGLASTANLAVGMAASGTGIAAGAVIASIDSSSQVTLSKQHTGTVTSGTIAFAGDAFNFLLVKVGPSGTYDATLTNVGTPGTGTPSASNVGTDETSGTGYTSGGFGLTNSNPATAGTTAFWTFGANPTWTGATFSAIAGVIYNTAKRLGGIANRVLSVHDFGGTQTVSSGSFTVTLPSNTNTTAILRIA